MTKKHHYVDRYTGKGKEVSVLFGIPIKTTISDNEVFGDYIERNYAGDSKPDWQFSHTEPIRVSSNLQMPGPGFFQALMLCAQLGRKEKTREAAVSVYKEICDCPADNIHALLYDLRKRYPEAVV